MRIQLNDLNSWQENISNFHEKAVNDFLLDELVAVDLYIILEELVSNYFKYSIAPGYNVGINISIDRIQESIEIVMEYEAVPFNPFMYNKEEEFSVESARIGGKGLYLVGCLADSYFYNTKDKKIILKLTKRLNSEDIMNITIEDISGITVVHLDGRLDILSGENLQKTIDELIEDQKKYQILVDCEKLSFISSAGLRLFMIALKKLNKLGGRLAFSAFNGNNKKIFEITGYNKFFSIFSSVEEGVATFNS